MSDGAALRLARKARLRWDCHSEATFLLLPEKAIRLNGTAAEILRRCDGTLGLDGIVAVMVACSEGADAAVVRGDVASFLAEMRSRGVVEGGDDGGR